jgi:Skp family chaperone for outer membrane proteins
MKLFKYILIFCFFTISTFGQRGIKVAYVDVDYILDELPEYKQATSQLDMKAQEWRTEIETKQNQIDQLKAELENERPLLTADLILDYEDEISYLESQLLELRNKRFGVSGDFITQKRQLIQPVQDQIFNAIQELGENRDYDFIFENSADALLLFSARRHDISDVILKLINRDSRGKGKEVTNVIEEVEDYKSVEKAKEDKIKEEEKAFEAEEKEREREALIDERQRKRDSLREARRKEIEARRAKLIKEREEKLRVRDSIQNARRRKNN